MNIRQSVRKFCLECVGGSSTDVALCTAPDCPLWEHRVGHAKSSLYYRRTMDMVQKRYPKLCADLEKDYGLDPEIYFGEVKP